MAQKKKPNFFSSVTGALDDVINEIKADVKSMTPPGEGKPGDPRKAREQAEYQARMSEIVGQSASGLAVSSLDDTDAEDRDEPQEYEPEQHSQPTVAKPILTMPTGNLWRALKDPALTQRLHADACYHAVNVGDIKHYYHAVFGQELAPFTLGILALNLPALTAEEVNDEPDLLIQAMMGTLKAEPRIYGAVGAGPRSLWSDPELLDEYLSELLNENPKLIALGPVGLDEPFAPYTIPQQQIQLAKQLEIAADFGLPVLITCRNSHAQLGEVLSAQAKLPQLVYLEPFTTQADVDLANRFNMSVLLRPELTTPNQPLGVAYRALPQSKLLLGCGSSLVAPHGFSGHFNEPKFIQNTLDATARLLNLKPSELLAITNRNLSQLFPQASAA